MSKHESSQILRRQNARYITLVVPVKAGIQSARCRVKPRAGYAVRFGPWLEKGIGPVGGRRAK